MTKPYKAKIALVNIVCFQWSMFRGGNGEPGNYTHIIPMHRDMFLLLLLFVHLAQFGTYDTNFAVMMTMLVVATTDKTQLVEANQHFLSNIMLTVPKSHINRMQKH